MEEVGWGRLAAAVGFRETRYPPKSTQTQTRPSELYAIPTPADENAPLKMLARCGEEFIHAVSISPTLIPPGPSRMFSPIVENPVLPISPPMFWCTSDCVAAIW